MDKEIALYELAQCREDERVAESLKFQMLVLIFTFLAFITTFDINGEMPFSVTVSMLSVILLQYTSVGVIASIRHHYMVDLEKQLKAKIIPNETFDFWKTFSTSLISYNPRRFIKSRFKVLMISSQLVVILLLGSAILYVYQMVQLVKANITLQELLFVVMFVLCLMILIYSYVKINNQARTIYLMMKKETKKDLNFDKKSASKKRNRLASYLLYPRPNEAQKSVFILIGYGLGLIISLITQGDDANWNIQYLCASIFIIDYCVYQARYQINDLRGLRRDLQHPMKNKRTRLPIEEDYRKSIISSVVVLTGRVVMALMLCIAIATVNYSFASLISGCVLSVLLISALYEIVSIFKQGKAILLVVLLGYPIRVIAGVIAAYPDIMNVIHIHYGNLIFKFLFIIILSLTIFSGVIAHMCWLIEAIYLKSHLGKIDNKIQLNILLDNFQAGFIRKDETIAVIDRKTVYRRNNILLWKSEFIIASFLATCSLIWLDKSNVGNWIIELLVFVVIIYTYKAIMDQKKPLFAYIIFGILVVVDAIFSYTRFVNVYWMLLVLAVHSIQVLYLVFYFFFYFADYQALNVNFFGNIKFFLYSLIRGYMRAICGKETMGIFDKNSF